MERFRKVLLPIILVQILPPNSLMRVSSSNLIQLALEYRKNLDLHIISQDIETENLSNLVGSFYASYYENSNSTVVKTLPIKRTEIDISGLNRFLPASKPDMLTSGKNLIPVKSILKAKDIKETFEVLLQVGNAFFIKENLVFPSLLVIWPERVASEDVAVKLLHSKKFQDASKNFNIASELIFAFDITLKDQREFKDESWLFYEIYNINKVHVVSKLDAGVVDFHCRFCKGTAIRRNNFYGLQLNVSATEDPEINDDIFFEKSKGGDLIFSKHGFSGRILLILQQSLNFSVKAMKATDWGKYIRENNSWVGSIKDVADGKADLGISITTMRPNLAELVSFLPTADESIISAFFRNPDLNAVRDIFARPFHVDLWAAVFTTWIVLAFFMIFFSIIRKRYDLHNNSGVPEPDFTQDSFICVLAMACQQGWDEHPTAGSLRTLFISGKTCQVFVTVKLGEKHVLGSITGVVAYAGYSAAIVSTLSLRVDPIQNADQLLKSSLKVGIREGFISELLLDQNTTDIISQFQQKLKATKEADRYFNISEGYRHLQKHRYAYLSTRDNLYDHLKATVNDSEICQLRELQILSRGFPMGHFTQRNSPFKESLRYHYVTIREPGVSWKLRKNFTYQKRCLEASDNTGNALGANDVFTAFMILSGGYFLSICFIVIEKLMRVGKTFSYLR